MRILNAADVRRALPMREAVVAMKHAFAALSSGHARVPPRVPLFMERNAGISLVMPAYVDADDPANQALTVKVVSLFDGNRRRGLARIQAAVMAFEPDTGRPAALLEGATLTAIRTAAASGAATDLLARPDSRTLALFGAGVQARAHLEAMLCVRPIERVWIYSRTPANVQKLIDELQAAWSAGGDLRSGEVARSGDRPQPWGGRHKQAGDRAQPSGDWPQRGAVRPQLMAATSPGEALAEADLVCAATTSSVPLFNDADLRPGTHVNAVGSFTPQAREIPPETVVRARVVVDSRHAAWAEAGDLIQPFDAGLIGQDHIHAELGELVLGRKTGRMDAAEITLFKSVGIAVQDALAAQYALANARRFGIGTEVDW